MTTPVAPILFLDFDGVMHPSGTREHETFSRMPLLAEALRGPLEAVRVVVSSDWRLVFGLEILRQHFPVDLRSRVVGCTPDETRATSRAWGAMAVDHPRQAQAMTWLARNTGTTRYPWVALDDRSDWFLPGERRLVVVAANVGLQPHHLMQVSEVLKAEILDT